MLKFSTDHNQYLLFPNKRSIIVSQPLLVHALNLIKFDDNPEVPDSIYLEKEIYTREDILYYIEKAKLLKENGYLTSPDKTHLLSHCEKEQIQNCIANVGHVIIELTQDCNLSCKYCFFGDLYTTGHKRKGGKLNFQLGVRFLDFLKEQFKGRNNNIKTYFSFYGGEPLLNFSLIEKIVTYIEDNFQFIDFGFNLTTNGVLVNKYLDYLVSKNFNITISLDGDKENNSYRQFKNGASSFDIVSQNIALIKKKYPKYFDNKVQFNSTIHEKNNSLDVIRYFKEKYNKQVICTNLSQSYLDKQNQDKFHQLSNEKKVIDIQRFPVNTTMKYENSELQTIHYILQKYNLIDYSTYSSIGKNSGIENISKMLSGSCLPFSEKIYLTVNGEILQCEHLHPNYKLGKVTENEITIDLEQITKNTNSFLKRIKRKCMLCYLANDCTHCLYKENELINDVSCNNFMGKKEYLKILSGAYSAIEKNPNLLNGLKIEIL